MYIIDGIAYSSTPKRGMEVESAVPLGDSQLLVGFSTGEARLFDGSPLRDFEAFAPLFDEGAFDAPTVIDGILTWKDGEIDISTAKVYSMSYPYNSVA